MKTRMLKLTAAALLLAGTLVSTILAQSTWHPRHPLPTPHGLLGVTYASGLHVAVGYHNTILTSPDAVTWTRRAPESPALLTDVLHTRGQFLAVGYQHSLDYRPEPGWEPIAVFLSSTNGIQWTPREVRQAFIPNQVIEWRGLLVSLGHVLDEESQWQLAMATSTDGLTWIERWRGDWVSSPGDRSLPPITVTDSTLLANPPWLDGVISSTNAIDWRSVAAPGQTFKHLATDGRRFIGVSHDNKAFVSEDGLAWDKTLGPPFEPPIQIRAVTYGGGEFLLLSGGISGDDPSYAHRSKDARVWTEAKVAEMSFGHGSHKIHTVSRMIRSPAGWVVVGQPQDGQGGVNNLARIFTSSDGVNWTNRTEEVPSLSSSWFLSGDTNGLLARRGSYNPEGSWQIRSDDGGEWSRPVFDPAPWDSPARRDLARATDGRNRVRIREETWGGTPEVPRRTVAKIAEHSLDGVAWRETFRREDWPGSGSLVVAHGNGQFLITLSVTGQDSPSLVFTSPDGLGWTKRWEGSPWWFDVEEGASGYLADLVVANGEFLVLTHSLRTAEFRLLSSATGAAWTANHVGWNLGYQASLFATAESLFAAGVSIQQSFWDLKLSALGRRADGTLELQVSGIVGQQIELQSTSSLATPDWQPISTAPLTASPMILTLPEGLDSPQRFYRAHAR